MSTTGGVYEKPNITCSECGKGGLKFSKICSSWICDSCMELEEIKDLQFLESRKYKAVKPSGECVNRFCWGIPHGE